MQDSKDKIKIAPFTSSRLLEKSGFYYGLNSDGLNSENMIKIAPIGNNVLCENGIVLGSIGAGMSFSSKVEMVKQFSEQRGRVRHTDTKKQDGFCD